MPETQAYADSDPDCELVTVLVGGPPDRARTVASRRGLRAPVLLDGDRSLQRRFEVDRTPTTFVLDRTGHARAVLYGGQTRDSLAKAVSRLR